MGSTVVPDPEELDLVCVISQDLFEDPVFAADGFTYSRASIATWVESHDTSPHTNERLPHLQFTPNRRAQKHVEAYKEKLGLKLIELLEQAPRKPECEQLVRTYLHEGKANLNARRERDRRTPLLVAAELGLRHLVDALLESGAEYAATDCDGVGIEDLLPDLREAHKNEVMAMDAAKKRGDFKSIVRMLKEATGARVQIHGCRVVWKLIRHTRDTAQDDSNKDHEVALVSAGGIEAVINCMRSHPAHAGVQEEGCVALRCLSNEDVGKVRVAQHGGIKVILQALECHRGRAVEMQHQGCWVLGVVSNVAANRRTVAESGGMDIVLHAMRHHPNSTKVQKSGCYALGNIVACDAANQHDLARKGGMDLILKAMRQHQDAAEVQAWGCYAFGNETGNDQHYRVQIAEMRGIEVIIQAMKQHIRHEEVQKWGCYALGNIPVHTPANQRKIAELDGIDVILRAMNTHKHAQTVQQWGCYALGNLAVNVAENQREIIQKGGIGVIIRATREHQDCKEVQQWGCYALGNTAGIDANQRRTIAVEGGIEAAFAAMRQHGNREEVQKWGCYVVSAMVLCESARPAIREGRALMEAALRRYPRNADLRQYAQTGLRCCKIEVNGTSQGDHK